MSNTPSKKNNSRKESHSTSKKKKRQESSETERSAADTSALSDIVESEEHGSEEETEYDAMDPACEHQGGGGDYHRGMQEMATMLNGIYEAVQLLTEDMSGIRERVDGLESPRRDLRAEEGYRLKSPTKKDHHRSPRRNAPMSMTKMMARSAVKQDWRELLKGSGNGGDDSGGSSSSEGESDKSTEPDTSDKEPKEKPKRRASDKERRGNREHEEAAKKRNPLGQLLSNLDDTAKAAAQTVVNVTRVEKECTVRITDFSLAKVCRAMKSIIEFQERENTPVKMTRVLSEACKGHLNNKYSINSSDLLDMPLSSLFSIMAKETKVLSKVQFYNELKQALSFATLMDWDKVTPANHEAYYFQQLNLAKDFMLVLRLMLEENKELCPKVEDKENGLIRLFKSFHSYSYWKYLWPTMSNSRYKTMKEFMDEYLEIALDHYTLSQSYKAMPYVGSSKAADTEKKYFEKKRDISKNLNTSYSRPRDTYKGNSLSHMQADEDSGESDGSQDPTWKNATAEATEQQQKLEGNDSDDSLSVASNEDKGSAEDDQMLDNMLAAFAEHKPNVKADRKDYPCLRKILSGNCDHEGCPYGHRKEVLLKGAEDMRVKLATFVKTHGGTPGAASAAPYKVLSKDKYVKT